MIKNKGKKFLSDLKLYSDYLKWQEDQNRYETWEEACQDIINGHKQTFALHPNTTLINSYLDDAVIGMTNQDVLASQRSLQYRYNEIVRHNTRLYNCTVGYVARNDIFQKIFYLLLSGCGYGGGILLPMIQNLSKIEKRKDDTVTFTIPDSIEGWADSLGVLLSSYFSINQPFPEYAGKRIRFDYSQIREKGAYISGGFRAPGPESLKASLEAIENLIEQWLDNEGNTIRPILAADIICLASEAVLAGGVRRSALNMIVDPNDEEMIMAKTGNWRTTTPWRGRSNNSVLLVNGQYTKEFFDRIVNLNQGDNDLGFVFANSWFDMFNPCFEISFTPILTNEDLLNIKYEDVYQFIKNNIDNIGIMGCNLTEINGEKPKTLEEFLTAARRATILGTIQAYYTSFPYLGKISEDLFKREALLGVSITGITNNPMLLNAEWLQMGAAECVRVNKELAEILGINQAARITCIKPSGNASVVLGTASGIHPEHARQYFRIMQLNKESDTAKYLEVNQPYLIENSVWSANNTDYVVYIPIINPKDGLYKEDLKGVKHLKVIELVQKNWVVPGTNTKLGISKKINHNVSATVILDNKEEVINYIWENKENFTALSFLSDYGDKDYNQAPFTSVLTDTEIVEKYGKGAILASGLVVDGLHYFNNNLWNACECVLNREEPVTGTREQVLLKEYWIKRAKKFAKNYFKNNLKQMVYCLKDIHLFHKWETINRDFKEVDFSKILDKPTYKDISDYGAQACSGGVCEITKI